MEHHTTLISLTDEAQAGYSDAGEVLGYIFTGLISTALPELGLGYHRYVDEDDRRLLRWFNPQGEEVVRVALVGGGNIQFCVYDHGGDRWGGTTFPSIETMIKELRRIAGATNPETKPLPERRTPARSRRRR